MTAYDVLLDSKGDLPAGGCYLSSGPEVIAQRLTRRLRTHLGEWFLDQFVGMPYTDWLQTKPVNPPIMSARIRAEVAACPGILGIVSWSYTWDAPKKAFATVGECRIVGEASTLPVVVTFADVSTGNALPFVAFATRAR
jgi:hypothetical protein